MPDVKGGFLARSAAMLCQDESFRLYLDRAQSHKAGIDIPDGTHDEDDARDLILSACNISSRAELDHDFSAAARFRKIKNHFRRWADRQSRRQTLTGEKEKNDG